MEILSTTYQERKKSFTDLFELSETYEKRVEHLLIHSYNIRIAERKNDRSMQNTKLVDFLEGSLHSTKDYLLAVQSIIGISEINTYLKKNILITPMDFPGQKNIRRAIVHRMTNGEQSNIPSQILNIIPFISPLHISLNSRETVFLINYDFFKKMYHAIFGLYKILAKKPKPYQINLLLELAFRGWSLIKKSLESFFHIFNDYYVENFHSSIRYQTNSFNTAQQIINQAKVIDQTRGKNSFNEIFSNNHNIIYTAKQLEFLEKKTAIFLLDLFQNIWKNRGHTTKKKIE